MVTKALQQENFDCPIAAVLAMLGGRWKILILYQLEFGTRRFGEIAVRIPSISRKVLTEQLKALENDGLIVRRKIRETPPRVEYSLTKSGEALSSLFEEMEKWGNAYLSLKK